MAWWTRSIDSGRGPSAETCRRVGCDGRTGLVLYWFRAVSNCPGGRSFPRRRLGDDGLAYLRVDTSWAAPGYEAWMDVLVGGQYAGGLPLSITDSGGCADNPDMVELSADVAVSPESGTAQNWSTSAGSSSDAVRVGVLAYQQQRNLSCEYSALAMAMGAYGVGVSEYDFDDRVGLSENPHWGYRGDISGRWGNTD